MWPTKVYDETFWMLWSIYWTESLDFLTCHNSQTRFRLCPVSLKRIALNFVQHTLNDSTNRHTLFNLKQFCLKSTAWSKCNQGFSIYYHVWKGPENPKVVSNNGRIVSPNLARNRSFVFISIYHLTTCEIKNTLICIILLNRTEAYNFRG